MNCKTCEKDITALYYFTRKEYCSKKCEEHKIGDIENLFGGIFKKK